LLQILVKANTERHGSVDGRDSHFSEVLRGWTHRTPSPGYDALLYPHIKSPLRKEAMLWRMDSIFIFVLRRNIDLNAIARTHRPAFTD